MKKIKKIDKKLKFKKQIIKQNIEIDLNNFNEDKILKITD